MSTKIGKSRVIGRYQSARFLLVGTCSDRPSELLHEADEPVATSYDQRSARFQFDSVASVEITREEPCAQGAYCYNICCSGRLTAIPERLRTYEQVATLQVSRRLTFQALETHPPLHAVATERPSSAAVLSVRDRLGQLLGYRIAIPDSALYMRGTSKHLIASQHAGANIK